MTGDGAREPLLEVEAEREQQPARARGVRLAGRRVRLEEPAAHHHRRAAAPRVRAPRQLGQGVVREP